MVRMSSGRIRLQQRELHVQATDVQQDEWSEHRDMKWIAGYEHRAFREPPDYGRSTTGKRHGPQLAPAGGRYLAALYSCAPSSLQGNGPDPSQHIAL